MMKTPIKLYLFLLAVVFFSCKEKFEPTVTTVNSNILVVEGMIETGADSTIIKLSRTVVIANKNGTAVEKGATVTVESDANESFQLLEKTAGQYISPGLGLNSNKRYRLRIKTAKGQIYVSDFTEAKVTPPINIGYQILEDGLQIQSNAQDLTNKSLYYKWDCTETYILHPAYLSAYIYNGVNIVNRDMTNNDVYTCWKTIPPQAIYLASSVKLDRDIISNNPLVFIPKGSDKLQDRYSIFVRQSTLTKEAFEFWQELKKNTENLGSIFDAQPSQLMGNIHNVANAAEPVIGYISAGTTRTQRIYINSIDLPRWSSDYFKSCITLDTVLVKDFKNTFTPGGLVPVEPLYSPGGSLTAVTAATPFCADCTVRGSNKKPAFWQ